jgi:hypothetical protein
MNYDGLIERDNAVPLGAVNPSMLDALRRTLVTLWAMLIFLLVPAFFLSFQGSWMRKVADSLPIKEANSQLKSQAPQDPPADAKEKGNASSLDTKAEHSQ